MRVEFTSDTGIDKFPRLIRRGTGLMEFLCQHGVGHPAPSSAAFMNKLYGHDPGTWETHGCDGCCEEGLPDTKYHPPRIEVVTK